MLSFQTTPRRLVVAVVVVRDAAAAAVRAKGGIPGLMSDVLRGVRSVTSEEVAPLMLARYFADLGARFGAGAATRALAALTQPGTGLTVERGGRSLYPIVAWVEMAPESGVPVVPIPGVEVLDVFYPEEPATAIPRHEHASMWLWMTGIVAGALAIVHFGARRG